jgi:hypothetical protein
MLSFISRRGASAPKFSLAPIASAFVIAAVAAPSADAGFVSTFEVGTGINQATVQIDQDDGDTYLFAVRFASESISSWDALLTIDAALDSLSLEYETYSFGVFLTGITIEGDRDYGMGDLWPVPNYWQFWVDSPSGWTQSSVGAQARTITAGSADAWVFGTNAEPRAIPTPAAGIAALLMMGAGRRRAALRR